MRPLPEYHISLQGHSNEEVSIQSSETLLLTSEKRGQGTNGHTGSSLGELRGRNLPTCHCSQCPMREDRYCLLCTAAASSERLSLIPLLISAITPESVLWTIQDSGVPRARPRH